MTATAAAAQLASTNAARSVRERLAEARRRGESFDSAWRDAVESLDLDSGDGHRFERAARSEWRSALYSARWSFERAYNREPASAAEVSVRDLVELLPA